MTTLTHSLTSLRGPVLSAPMFEMSLHRNDLWRVRLNGKSLPIRCLRGAVWITREDSREDLVLPAGGVCELAGRGLALVGAVSDAVVHVGA